MSNNINLDTAQRIAKRHGYRDGKPMQLLDMMKIVNDAYNTGYERAEKEQLNFTEADD